MSKLIKMLPNDVRFFFVWFNLLTYCIACVEMLCPICFEPFVEPHMTRCGHTFCRECLERALAECSKCPKCETVINQSDYFPNHSLNEILRRKEKKKLNLENLTVEQIVNMPGRLPIDSISSIIEALQERREVLEDQQKRAHNQILHRFLIQLKVEKQKELDKIR